MEKWWRRKEEEKGKEQGEEKLCQSEHIATHVFSMHVGSAESGHSHAEEKIVPQNVWQR